MHFLASVCYPLKIMFHSNGIYGVHVWGNGDKYEGEWLGSLRHGNGSDFFTNGDVFVGQYVNGKPEGFGQYKWVNGSSYTGQFKGGVKDGHGKWKKK